MVCVKYERRVNGLWGSFQADTLPATLPETWEGIDGPGSRAPIAPGSELLITGTGDIYVKKVGSGWDKL